NELLESNMIEEVLDNDLTGNLVDSDNTDSGNINSDVISSSNLVGHWKMDEGNGSALRDYSGNGNHARIENDSDVSWVSGIQGQALQTNGRIDRFSSVPHNSSLNITESITMSAWIRPSGKSKKQILSKGDVYELLIFENGKVEFRINRDSNAKDYMIQSKKDYANDGRTWMHVAVTFDGRKSTIYINGEEDNSTTFNSTKINSNNAPVQIGAKYGDNRWTGALDDVRLYNEALSSSQIRGIYK
ncbi:MAG: LamG domain-containing protein, partial [Cyclobacteriaceae bacterium]